MIHVASHMWLWLQNEDWVAAAEHTVALLSQLNKPVRNNKTSATTHIVDI